MHWWNNIREPSLEEPLALFLRQLSDQVLLQVRFPLPEQLLVIPMACIAAAYQDLFLNQGKQGRAEYLEASVEALVGYHETLIPLLSTPPSPLTTTLMTANPKGLVKVYEALTRPYKEFSDHFYSS